MFPIWITSGVSWYLFLVNIHYSRQYVCNFEIICLMWIEHLWLMKLLELDLSVYSNFFNVSRFLSAPTVILFPTYYEIVMLACRSYAQVQKYWCLHKNGLTLLYTVCAYITQHYICKYNGNPLMLQKCCSRLLGTE